MTVQTQIKLPENIDDLVDQYVRLRDKIKEADDAHKKKVQPAKTHLELLNNTLLERLNNLGGESVKTASGTVYRTSKRSASIADGSVFREYVIDNAEWNLVDWRANSTAVDDYIKSNEVPPPGVNFSVHYVVGVRRPTDK